ncbi:MAG: hypothetical protein NC181_02395 [Clostridium sp.]|nr:hypothetical protein [Clostridium sp.]MCM1443734.1 hypothetical protein [Candidatus Amulumruptor caecigallinarius]
MIYTYEELKKQKEQGKKLSWDDISKEQLEELFINEKILNNMIAELYDINPERVRSKRRKWNITIYSSKYIYKRYQENENQLFENLNTSSKERLLSEENIDWISKALTHYVFRNGPVEDIHAKGQLSQSDMKILNKYMVNKIAGLLKLMHDGEWLKIELMLNFLKCYGSEWDKAEYDTKDIDIIFKNAIGYYDEVNDKTNIGV